jgi:hypothetical protein
LVIIKKDKVLNQFIEDSQKVFILGLGGDLFGCLQNRKLQKIIRASSQWYSRSSQVHGTITFDVGFLAQISINFCKPNVYSPEMKSAY